MKALLSHAPGGPETLVLRDLPDPEPGPAEVRIAVRTVGINFPDTLIIEDKYQFRPDRPFAPGAELVGVVDALGDGVSDLRVGDRVMALPMWGALAEKICIAETRCHRLPDAVGDEQAACLQMTYGTALYALEQRGDLTEGESLLVLGAAGGVGLAAVELGAALGARVIAAASSESKVGVARDHGASDSLVYPEAPLERAAQKQLSDQIKHLAGAEGVDVVMDIVVGDYTEPALRATAWGGRVLIVGFPAGIARIPANLPLLKSCDIRGIFWGGAIERDWNRHRTDMARLVDMCAAGQIRPRVHQTFPLAEGGAAIRALSERGVIGKVCVTL
ncbi:alcohol dehydrogenase, zinc-containing [Pseudooceanicola batsensis HTCC2597]|uniref:Alcohol dehydrogenase, zinc-containing n=1 Tax=Pseudooceanicola batsensis (strain ATCC BAA-863 / DSM 15984 / KCTC 12145 / HTCC2597) TaxID=252305 RepID=A3U1E5_PSEBH|nr:NADPH:quinone oxidoreductase family protein [Pseudooceanicola batsensis]EAQ02128.1 alcohol dehydrogenase, zinc-containing [Pseudooceanicola batsensis HTCC2597]